MRDIDQIGYCAEILCDAKDYSLHANKAVSVNLFFISRIMQIIILSLINCRILTMKI